MIRVVSVEEQDPAHLTRVCKALNAAFGVGAEVKGTVPLPAGIRGKDKAIDPNRLMAELQAVTFFKNDQLFFVTSEPLAPRALFTGKVPSFGAAEFGKVRGLVSSANLGKGDDQIRRLAKHAVHQAGHLFNLHHCLDGRCSMHPQWAESFANGDPLLCSFCRDKSDKVIAART